MRPILTTFIILLLALFLVSITIFNVLEGKVSSQYEVLTIWVIRILLIGCICVSINSWNRAIKNKKIADLRVAIEKIELDPFAYYVVIHDDGEVYSFHLDGFPYI